MRLSQGRGGQNFRIVTNKQQNEQSENKTGEGGGETDEKNEETKQTNQKPHKLSVDDPQ